MEEDAQWEQPLGDVNITSYKTEQVEALNELYSRLQKLHTFELQLFIYRLVQNGYAKKADIARALNVSRQRVGQIVDKFSEMEKAGQW